MTHQASSPNLCLISPGSGSPFFLKCHRVWTNWHTSVSLQPLHPPFSFFHCGFKQMQSNPIRGEWEQHRRGAGNSNFVQLVPAVTSPHLNEPLDNPQKYDPSERGREAVSPLSSFPAERLLTGLSPLCVWGHRSDTDEPVGTGEVSFLLSNNNMQWLSKPLLDRWNTLVVNRWTINIEEEKVILQLLNIFYVLLFFPIAHKSLMMSNSELWDLIIGDNTNYKVKQISKNI